MAGPVSGGPISLGYREPWSKPVSPAFELALAEGSAEAFIAAVDAGLRRRTALLDALLGDSSTFFGSAWLNADVAGLIRAFLSGGLEIGGGSMVKEAIESWKSSPFAGLP